MHSALSAYYYYTAACSSVESSVVIAAVDTEQSQASQRQELVSPEKIGGFTE